MGVARLLLRVTVGGLFVGHGMQKLAGWFGGPGPDGLGHAFESAGLRPGKVHAVAAGAAEAGGGALLALGLATPAAVAALSGVMVTAIRHVHWSKGIWSTQGGWEYNATILAALAALAETGPGPLSLDSALGIELKGAPVALGALAAGAAGSYVVSEIASRVPPLPSEDEESRAAADEPLTAGTS